jgi:MraZ protein
LTKPGTPRAAKAKVRRKTLKNEILRLTLLSSFSTIAVEFSGAKWSRHGVLRGNISARIDDKGRLKIPNAFRAFIEEQYGSEVFVTSLTGESVWIYPMPVWAGLESRLSRVPSTHPSRGKYVDRVNFYGQVSEVDKQGRVLIHPRLRESAGMLGEVDVFGQYNYLEIWNHDRFVSKLQREPFTEQDARALSEFGI